MHTRNRAETANFPYFLKRFCRVCAARKTAADAPSAACVAFCEALEKSMFVSHLQITRLSSRKALIFSGRALVHVPWNFINHRVQHSGNAALLVRRYICYCRVLAFWYLATRLAVPSSSAKMMRSSNQLKNVPLVAGSCGDNLYPCHISKAAHYLEYSIFRARVLLGPHWKATRHTNPPPARSACALRLYTPAQHTLDSQPTPGKTRVGINALRYTHLNVGRGVVSKAGQPCRNICQFALHCEVVDAFCDNLHVCADAKEIPKRMGLEQTRSGFSVIARANTLPGAGQGLTTVDTFVSNDCCQANQKPMMLAVTTETA